MRANVFTVNQNIKAWLKHLGAATTPTLLSSPYDDDYEAVKKQQQSRDQYNKADFGCKFWAEKHCDQIWRKLASLE